MRDTEQRAKAKAFAEYWADKGYEKGESQPFWLELLREVYGVENPAHFITFEEQVHLDHTSFIDGYIPSTHVLIEQKGKSKDLRKPIKQSDGTLLTPFQQAQRYSAALPYSQRPRWIVACNFEEFLVYDMENPNSEPESIKLKNLPKEYYRLQFLVDSEDENIKREMEVSIKAGKLVGVLYDEILKQYINPDSEGTLKSLNILCVRLVFCLYAEDAGIFGGHNKFHDYIKSYPVEEMRNAIISLFKILDTKPQDRDPYLNGKLSEFPYVNGGLFAEENIEIPQFNEKIRDLLLHDASAEFDWSDISPTIFGAVFESTLNPETRRSGGMHYTSIENIHKVIDPLFLDELRDEFLDIKAVKVAKTKEKKLNEFRDKLASLTFLDPACGSGNFLTETYISLRRLENEALKEIYGDQIVMDIGDIIRVSIGQFYGIEINDFAVTVAKTALWIAESQMMKETEDIVHQNLEFLPLKSYANIIEANALRIDWEDVVPKEKLNYIMGNPPFVSQGGSSNRGQRQEGAGRTHTQSEDMRLIFGERKGCGNLDYVSCWFQKAYEYMDRNIEVAFVSTNSISQGQQVAPLWKPMIDGGVHINFAHQSFLWDSETNNKALVYVIIVGFSFKERKTKRLYTYKNYKSLANVIPTKNINAYLLADSPNVFIETRTNPISKVSRMVRGGGASDWGYLMLSETEKDELVKAEPNVSRWIRPFLQGNEFINNIPRYCLWMVGISPKELQSMPKVLERIQAVKEQRLLSKKSSTRKKAETPWLFDELIIIESDYYIAVPQVSAGSRKYIPMGYVSSEVIAGNKLLMVPGGSKYEFGILSSIVHNSWVAVVASHYGPSYQYSANIAYNNFPWPTPTDEQKAKIEQTAQAILDARELYPECSLADLYDELTMPPELRKAHQENDKAVMKAYGFKKDISESAIVAELMKMYQILMENK